MMEYYRVILNLYDITLPDSLEYGYEYDSDFRRALWRIIDCWKNRIGERIDERNGFFLLRFPDTPGGKLDEAWIPKCLLVSVDTPPMLPEVPEPPDEITVELDNVFDFT